MGAGEAAHPPASISPSLGSAKHPACQIDRSGVALAREQGLKPNFILGARQASSLLPGLRWNWCFKKRKCCPRTRNCDSYS